MVEYKRLTINCMDGSRAQRTVSAAELTGIDPPRRGLLDAIKTVLIQKRILTEAEITAANNASVTTGSEVG